MCSDAERADALGGITLLEMMARLLTSKFLMTTVLRKY
jgi:hypothetical protein